MASWQIRGLLLLSAALVAIALAASTSGAVPKRSANAAAVGLPIATGASHPVATAQPGPSVSGHRV